MARLFLHDNLKTIPEEDFRAYLESLFATLQESINEGPDLAVITDVKTNLPQGMRSGDIIFNYRNGELSIGIYNGLDVQYTSFGSFTGAITNAQHGTRAGANLHEVATPSVNGFMSAGDKTRLDQYKGDTSSSGPASLTEYPTAGDWGFHNDTTAATFVLARNIAGTIRTVAMT